MISQKTLCKKKKIHFIGIGGISMSALAKYFLMRGYTVSGSDTAKSAITAELEKLQITVYYKHLASNIDDVEVIIYNSAISEKNAELEAAKAAGKLIISRAAILQTISQDFDKTIAVCGSHGKTTATAIIANMLQQTLKNICAHIGGQDANLNNFYYGGSDFFITEA